MFLRGAPYWPVPLRYPDSQVALRPGGEMREGERADLKQTTVTAIPVGTCMQALADHSPGVAIINANPTAWEQVSDLFPMIKLLRLLRIGRIFDRLFDIKPQAAKVLRIVNMVIGLLLTSHLFGCFFWYVSFETMTVNGGATWTSGSNAVVKMCSNHMRTGTCIESADPANNTFAHYDKDIWVNGCVACFPTRS